MNLLIIYLLINRYIYFSWKVLPTRCSGQMQAAVTQCLGKRQVYRSLCLGC